MKVRDLGLKPVYCAAPEAPLREIAALMRDHDVGAMPICDNRKLVGIITDRDIVITCAAMGNSSLDCQARNFMTKNPITVTLDHTLEEVAQIMGEKQVRRLPVLGGDRVVGMVSLGDIALVLRTNDKLVANTLRRVSTPVVQAISERREVEVA